ncbi:MAG TPA: class I SAM-dependent methyltransferase [Anaerolineaceae bacterium]|nr:class I SAM-dependent methyltransferase [Anaerolineaceae bacterium]
MGFKADYYPESRFGGFSDIDGTLIFYTRVHALCSPQAVVIDYGCGRGAYGEDPIPTRRDLRIFKGKATKVIGLDVDAAGEDNPYLDEFHRLAGSVWPLPDGCADLCVCDNVLEHLLDPAAFFAEAGRVLKPGGYLCIRTPNKWSYVALAARLVPSPRHADVLEKVKDQVKRQDVFPTLYRCNTIPAIRRALREHHFVGVVYGYEAEPGYLSFSRLAYALGVLHQRLAPRIFKPAIFAFAQKQA